MRRFPGCWTTDLLAALGFRRVIKKTKTESRRRRSQIEHLEARQMLSASPLEESFVLDVAATLGAPTVQVATTNSSPLPVISEAKLSPQLSGGASKSDAPVTATYVLANPGQGNNPNQFRIETEYSPNGSARAVVRLLESDLGASNLDTTLQELHLELRAGSVVLERQEVLIDIAEADFRAKFLAYRVNAAQGEITQSLNAPAGSRDDEPLVLESTPEALETAEPVELITTTPEERKDKLDDLAVGSSAIDLAEVANLQVKFGDVVETSADKIKLFNSLVTAISTTDGRPTASQSDVALKTAERRLLGHTTVLLSTAIAAEIASSDPAVKAAAESARDKALASVGSEFTVFTGLSKNQELRRVAPTAGAGEQVLGAIETGAFQANATLRIELGGQQALVQVVRRTGASGSAATAPAQIENATLTQDAYSVAGSGSVNNGELTVSGTGAKKTAYMQFDLTPYVGQNLSSGVLKLNVASGSGVNKITAYKDLFTSSSQLWTESTLNDSTAFPAGFSAPLGSSFSASTTNPLTVDVTEAVKRASLIGDSNGTGTLDFRGLEGDVNAFYWSVVNPAVFAANFPSAGAEGLARNDINWDGVVTTLDVAPMFSRWGLLQGDFNFDGSADLRDYSIWQKHINEGRLTSASTGGFTLGDANFNGALDFGDYYVWYGDQGSVGNATRNPSLTLRVEAVDSSTVNYYSKETTNSPTVNRPSLQVTREFVVNSLEDGGLPASYERTLRATIDEINSLSAANPSAKFAISFAPQTRGVIKLNQGLGQLNITAKNVRIIGPGANLLSISGGGASRVFNIDNGTAVQSEVWIEGLTIADGKITGTGNFGAGIRNLERLTLNRVNVVNNLGEGKGGGVGSTEGSLTILESTIDGNTAAYGGGVAVFTPASGAVVIRNSTISNNRADVGSVGAAGGIHINGDGPGVDGVVTITNSTISGNFARQWDGAIRMELATAIISQSTITNNESSAPVSVGGVSAVNSSLSLYSSIISGNKSPYTEQNVSLEANSTAGNFIGGDPMLLPLGDYGGPTKTHLPKPGSPVIGLGSRRYEYDELVKSDTPTFHYRFDGAPTSSVSGPIATLVEGGANNYTTTSAAGSQALKTGPLYATVTPTIGSSFTYESWAKSDSAAWNEYAWIASSRQANGFIIHPEQGGKVWSAFIYDSNGAFHWVGMHTPVDIQSWHHYALTYDEPTRTATMYFDGQAVATQVFAPNEVPRTSGPVTIKIGRDDGGNIQRLGYGAIDEAALYATALSPAAIAKRFTNSDQRGLTTTENSTWVRSNYGSVETVPSIISAGDFDGDGRKDQVYQDPYSRALFVTSGAPGVQTVSNWGSLPEYQGNASFWKVGDFDGDGRDDLAIRRSTGSWTIAFSETNRFKVIDAAPNPFPTSWTDFDEWDPSSTIVGDFDKDGRDELIGRKNSSSPWQRWTYSDAVGVSFVSTGVTNLPSYSVLFAGDANRDGRDDLIAKVSGAWQVSLASSTGSQVSFGSPSAWSSWLDNGLSAPFDVEDRYQKLLDTFSEVYNGIKMELYPGLMKGPQATEETKAGNDWDQAALLVKKLEEKAFDADIVFGTIEIDFSKAADWLGISPMAPNRQSATIEALRRSLDPAADFVGTTKVRFRHTWVQVKAPHDTDFGYIYLDPSWKMESQRLLSPPDLSNFFGGYAAVNGRPGRGTFDEYGYLANSEPNQLPTEWYADQLTRYYQSRGELVSLADISNNGQIVQVFPSRLPSTPATLDSGAILVGTPQTRPNLSAILSDPNDSALYVHRVQVTAGYTRAPVVPSTDLYGTGNLTFEELNPGLNREIVRASVDITSATAFQPYLQATHDPDAVPARPWIGEYPFRIYPNYGLLDRNAAYQINTNAPVYKPLFPPGGTVDSPIRQGTFERSNDNRTITLNGSLAGSRPASEYVPELTGSGDNSSLLGPSHDLWVDFEITDPNAEFAIGFSRGTQTLAKKNYGANELRDTLMYRLFGTNERIIRDLDNPANNSSLYGYDPLFGQTNDVFLPHSDRIKVASTAAGRYQVRVPLDRWFGPNAPSLNDPSERLGYGGNQPQIVIYSTSSSATTIHSMSFIAGFMGKATFNASNDSVSLPTQNTFDTFNATSGRRATAALPLSFTVTPTTQLRFEYREDQLQSYTTPHTNLAPVGVRAVGWDTNLLLRQTANPTETTPEDMHEQKQSAFFNSSLPAGPNSFVPSTSNQSVTVELADPPPGAATATANYVTFAVYEPDNILTAENERKHTFSNVKVIEPIPNISEPIGQGANQEWMFGGKSYRYLNTQSVPVGPDTTLEFSFRSTAVGTVHALGWEDDLGQKRYFQLAGSTSVAGYDLTKKVSGTTVGSTTMVLPIGKNLLPGYPRTIKKLIFVTDGGDVLNASTQQYPNVNGFFTPPVLKNPYVATQSEVALWGVSNLTTFNVPQVALQSLVLDASKGSRVSLKQFNTAIERAGGVAFSGTEVIGVGGLNLNPDGTVNLTITAIPPSEFTGGASLNYSSKHTIDVGQFAAVGLDANQQSPVHMARLNAGINQSLGSSGNGITTGDIPEFLTVASQKYWSDQNSSHKRIEAMTGAIPKQSWVGTGVIFADNSLLTVESGSLNYLQYGMAPRNLGVDLPNTTGGNLSSTLGTTHAEANQLMGWDSSMLESSLIESVIAAESISTIRGLKYAYHRSNANIAPLPGTTLDPAILNQILILESNEITGGLRQVRLKGKLSSAGLQEPNLIVDLDNPTNSPLQFLSEKDQDAIKRLLLNTDGQQVTGPIRVMVPERSNRVGAAGVGWDGVVFAATFSTPTVNDTIHNQAFAIRTLAGSGAYGGGYSSNFNKLQNFAIPAATYDRAAYAGDPVNVANGNMFRDETDFIYANLGVPLSFSRHYDSQSTFDVGLGIGWTHSFSDRLVTKNGTTNEVVWLTSQGAQLKFTRADLNSPWISPDSRFGRLAENGTSYAWYGADGMVYVFDKVSGSVTTTGLDVWSAVGRLKQITDRNDHGISVVYGAGYVPSEVRDFRDPTRKITFGAPNGTGNLTTVTRQTGEITPATWTFSYAVPALAGKQYLTKVTRPAVAGSLADSTSDRYIYGTSNKPAGLSHFPIIRINEYDQGYHEYEYYVNGRVFRVKESVDNNATPTSISTQTFSYDLFREKTEFTDERGNVETYFHSTTGQLLKQVHPDFSQVSYKYGTTADKDKELMIESVDENGAREIFNYYAKGEDYSLTDSRKARRGELRSTTSKDLILTEYVYWQSNDAVGYSHIQEVQQLKQSQLGVKAATINYLRNDRGVAYEVTSRDPVTDAVLLKTTYDLYSDPAKYGLVRLESRTETASGSTGNLPSNIVWRQLNVGNNFDLPQGDFFVDLWTNNGKVRADAVLLQRLNSNQEVVGSWIVDNSDAGFELLSDPTTDLGPGAFGADSTLIDRSAASTTPTAWGRWKFTNLPQGTYQAFATWQYDSGLAEAVFAMYKTPTYEYLSGTQVGVNTSFQQSAQPTSSSNHQNRTEYFYDQAGNVIRTVVDQIATGKTQYDQFGAPKESEDAAGVKSYAVRDYRGQVIASGIGEQTGASGLAKLESTFTYDALGRVKKATDPLKRETFTEYDLKGRLTKVTAADGSTMEYTYDGKGNRLTSKDALGRVTRYVYDERDRLVQTIYADGTSDRVQYDGLNRVKRTIDALGRTSEFTYDAAGRVLTTTIAKGTGQSVVTNAYDSLGRLVQVTDPNGFVTKNYYDALGRVTHSIVFDRDHTAANPMLTSVVGYKYDSNGRLSERHDYDSVFDPTRPTWMTAPDLNQLIANPFNLADYNDKVAAGKVRITKLRYDALDRVSQTINPDNTVTTVAYDPSGRMLFAKDELGRVSQSKYDEFGRLVKSISADPDGNLSPLKSSVSTIAYDAVGNAIAATDPRGVVTRTQYDLLNRAIATTNGIGAITRSIYDVAGQMTAGIDTRGFAVHTERDKRGRVILTRQVDPDGNGFAQPPTMTQKYDEIGNALEMVDARGFSTFYQYDTQNRLIKESPTISYIADNSSNPNTSGTPTNRKDDEFTVLQGTPTHSEGLLEQTPYGRDVTVVAGAAGLPPKVSWDITGLQPGHYRVLSTWTKLYTGVDPAAVPMTTVSTGVPGNLTSSTTTHATIDQRTNPTDFYREDGQRIRGWKEIATVTVGADGLFKLTLTGSSSSAWIQADAVMLESIGIGTTHEYDANGNRVLTTDARGNKSKTQYDELNRPITTISTDPDGTADATRALVNWTTYNGFGEVAKSQKGHLAVNVATLSATTRYMNDTTNFTPYRTDVFAYDVRGRLKSEMLADGTTVEVENRYYYDKVGNQVVVVQAYSSPTAVGPSDEVITKHTYDGLNRRVTATVDVGRAAVNTSEAPDLTAASPNLRPNLSIPTNFTYDAAGNVVRTSSGTRIAGGPAPYTFIDTDTVYDVLGRAIRTVDDSINVLEAKRAVSTVTYDVANNVVAKVDATGRRVRQVYDSLGRLISTTPEDPDGNGVGQSPAMTYAYDASGNLKAEFNGELEPTYYEYDSFGRNIRVITPVLLTPTNNEPPANDTELVTRYDAVGNVVATRDGAYNVVLSTYDKLNRRTERTETVALTSVSDAVASTTKWFFSKDGRLSYLLDPRIIVGTYFDTGGNTVQYSKNLKRGFAYDALDRLINDQWEEPLPTAAQPNQVRYHYNLTTYDKLDRITQSRFQYGGGGSGSPDNRNSETNFTYDNLGRILTETFKQPNVSAGATSEAKQIFTYDVASPAVVGDALSAMMHRQEVSQTSGGTQIFETTTSFDRLGREISVRDAGLTGAAPREAFSLFYTLDSAGRVKGINRQSGATLSSLVDVFASGFGHDKVGRLKNITHSTEAGDTIHRYDYQRDLASRVISTQQTIGANPLVNDYYTYDESGRLKSFSVSNAQVSSAVTLDDAGNRTDAGRVIGAGNRLLEDAQFRYEYDLAGNLAKRIAKVSSATKVYEWDYRNRLVSVKDYNGPDLATATLLGSTSLTYSADNQLLTKTVQVGAGVPTFERYNYADGQRSLVRDVTGRVKERLEYGPTDDAPLVSQTFLAGGAFDKSQWAATDQLGSVRDVVNSAGQLVNRLDYDPFGKMTKLWNGSGTLLADSNGVGAPATGFSLRALDAAFAGMVFDDDLKLSLHGARWYDPHAQVFISEDPVAADANLYRYASNDPVNYVDPTGLFTQSPLDYLPALGGGYSGNNVAKANTNLASGAINAFNNFGTLNTLASSQFYATPNLSSASFKPTSYSTFDSFRPTVLNTPGLQSAITAGISNGKHQAQQAILNDTSFNKSPAKEFGRGTVTGSKAIANATSSTLSLGFVNEPWKVNSYDRSIGYDRALVAANIGVGVGTAVGTGVLTTAARGTQYAFAAKTALAYDTLGNSLDVGRGSIDAYNQGGLTFGNTAQIVGGALGLGGNFATGSRALGELASDAARVRVSLDPTALTQFNSGVPLNAVKVSLAPNQASGGRLGSTTTRTHVSAVADELESRGWTINAGGGRFSEEYLPGPGGARRGSAYPDITATKGGRTLRVNTIDTLADGTSATRREANNATKIRSLTPLNHLLLIPKP